MTALWNHAKILLTFYHFTVLAVYCLSLKYDDLYVSSKVTRTFAGRGKYLTFWNEVLQTVYFAVSFLNDIFGSEVDPKEEDGKKRSSLQKLRDTILCGFAFPMGCMVVSVFWGLYFIKPSLVIPPGYEELVPRWLDHVMFVEVTFWGLYMVDRELVFPQVLDKIIPAWLNHVMHTTVIVFLLIEMYIVNHRFLSRKSGLSLCLGFAAIYQVWIFWIAFYADIWVYPILAVLPWPGRITFCVACWILLIGFYLFGEALNKRLWGVAHKVKAKKIA